MLSQTQSISSSSVPLLNRGEDQKNEVSSLKNQTDFKKAINDFLSSIGSEQYERYIVNENELKFIRFPMCYGVDKLVQLLNAVPSIRVLTLNACCFEGEHALRLAAAPNLTSLTIAYNEIKNKGAVALMKMGDLRFLDLSSNKIEDIGALKNVDAITLHTLNLSGNNLDEKDALIIANFLISSKNESLKKLKIGYNKIGNIGAIALMTSQNLRSLDLSSNNITELNDLESSGPVNLNDLNLNNNKLGRKGAMTIANFLISSKNNALKNLKISNNDIEDAGAIALSDTRLQSLTACSNALTVRSAIAFSKMLNLHTLDIGYNNLKDEGALALVESESISRLSVLKNNIGSEGAKAFAESSRLTWLDVRGNPIKYKDIELLLSSTHLLNLYINAELISRMEKYDLYSYEKEQAKKIHQKNQDNAAAFFKEKCAFLSVVTLTEVSTLNSQFQDSLNQEKQKSLLFKYHQGVKGNRLEEDLIKHIFSYNKPKKLSSVVYHIKDLSPKYI